MGIYQSVAVAKVEEDTPVEEGVAKVEEDVAKVEEDVAKFEEDTPVEEDVIMTEEEKSAKIDKLFETVRKQFSNHSAPWILSNNSQYDINSFREVVDELYRNLYGKKMTDEYFRVEVTKRCKTEEQYADESDDYYGSDCDDYW